MPEIYTASLPLGNYDRRQIGQQLVRIKGGRRRAMCGRYIGSPLKSPPIATDCEDGLRGAAALIAAHFSVR